MPDYTRPWSNSDPPGSRPAREIDNAIRELRVDISQRMDDITQNWEADPVQIRSGGLLNNWASSYTVVPGERGSPFGSARIQAQLLVPIIGQVNNGVFTIDLNLISQPASTGVNWDVSNLYYPDVPNPAVLISFPFSGVTRSLPRRPIQLVDIERVIDQNLLSFITRVNSDVYSDEISATVILPFLRV